MNPTSSLVVVETVYYQPPTDQPTSVESRFGRRLSTDEQPYSRRLEVTEEWKPLDHGWIESASMMVISHDSTSYSVNPTEEERQRAESQIVEIGILAIDPTERRDMHASPSRKVSPVVCFLLPPGESLRVQPASLDVFRIRCRGKARCTITLFPV